MDDSSSVEELAAAQDNAMAASDEAAIASEAAERAALLAEAEAMREQWISWMLEVRRYAVRMLEIPIVRRGNSPCAGGTNHWVTESGVPELTLTSGVGYTVGDEDAIRRRLLSTHSALISLDPSTLAHSSVAAIHRRVTAHRRYAHSWRQQFIERLENAKQTYRIIPQAMIDELLDILNAPLVLTLTPVSEAQADERAQLLAAAEQLRQQQIQWRLDIRRYARDMLNDAGVSYNDSPCRSGTYDWLRSRHIPPPTVNRATNRMHLGNHPETILAHIEQHRLIAGLAPANLASLRTSELPATIAAYRNQATAWRTNFINDLHAAKRDYPNIPDELICNLIARLTDPAPTPASAQGAGFPEPAAEPAIATPTPAPPLSDAEVTITIPLDLTAYLLELELGNAELAAHLQEKLTATLQRSISRNPGLALAGQITANVNIRARTQE